MSDPAALPGPASSGARRARRVIGFVIGCALLGAAVFVVARQGGGMSAAWESVRRAPRGLIALALVLPPMNLLVTSMSFWVQMRRHGRIGCAEMAALIGASWLLNCLPLRPGMFGRLAYHKAVNGIAVADSVRAMMVGLACGGAAVLVLLGLAAGIGAGGSAWVWGAGLVLPPAVVAAVSIAAGRGWLGAVFAWRYADVLIWALRYWVLFRLIGSPIGPGQAVAVTAVSQLALNVPLVGNGLGLREWGVGLTASSLPAGVFDSTGRLSKSVGLAADVVNRAAEVLVCVPLGLACVAWLWGRRPGRSSG